MIRGLLALALLVPGVAMSDTLPVHPGDGWHTWRVAASEGAPAWCCARWNRGAAESVSCDLTEPNAGMHADRRFGTDPVEMQLYAEINSGRIDDLRVYDARCPVETAESLFDHGSVATGTSIDWLESRTGTEDHALFAAVAVHAGNASLRLLEDYLSTANPEGTRKDALFWMGQVRFAESGGQIRRVLKNDADPALREHAAFVYSQSIATDRLAVLTDSGRRDSDPGVRAKAWFWLAQSDVTGAKAALEHAVASDDTLRVRKEAVFALSQLPGDSGVDALLGIVADQDLPFDVREQALFWLAHSDSPRATQVFDDLFAR